MMIGLAATYSTDKVASALHFGHQVPSYDYIERFNIYKNMYDNNTLGIYKDAFNNYPMELVRTVMSDGARNDEVLWLNYYTKEQKYNQSVYQYVNHTGTGVGYNNEKYHTLSYKKEYDDKYKLYLYNVPFADSVQRYWLVIDKGGICWNQSRVFQSLFNSVASPTIGSYQPAHEVSFYFIPNADGTGKWNMANNIFGWGKTATSWYGGNTYRTIFNWGNKSFANKIISSSTYGNNGGYVYLAQENLNKYDDYKKSLYLNLLANSYSDNSKKIEVYNLALKSDNINLDSYDNIINTYKKMNNITSDDWYKLASKIISNYTYYPMAMDDLLNVISPYLTGAQLVDIDKKEYNALNLAYKATSNEVLHDQAARENAGVLLNNVDFKIASFSFDGENANKIVFNDIYKDYDMAWHYSLDGGVTESKAITSKEYSLTDEEVSRINDVNDILIYIDGLAVDTPSYTIDIVKGVMTTTDGNDSLYANDLENRVVGVTNVMQWRYSKSDPWRSYSEELPVLTGDKTIQIRMAATGNALASDYNTYKFTGDNQPVNRKYISTSHLSIDSYSTQADVQGRYATNVIDGNYNTNWHTAWNGTDTERYIVIKIDNPVYLSAVEYVPGGGGNGKIIDGVIEESIDGVNWVTLGKKSSLSYTGDSNAYSYGLNNIKNFELDSSVLVKYVKITATKATNGNWFNAKMFNLYQDTTNDLRPTADVVYSTKEITNKDVVATLTNFSSENIKITSQGGNTHTFTENGTFTFIFVDEFTVLEGSTVAKVDWIDKVFPTATIEYSTTSPTNGSVIATLKPSEDVIVTNNGKLSITDDGKVLDFLGKVLKDYKADKNGNVTDNNGNYITNMSTFSYEFIQNGEFIFEFMDEAGNRNSVTAKVDWIDKDVPTASIKYDKSNKNKAIVRVVNASKEITFEVGSGVFEFTKNGTYEIVFYDRFGNRGVLVAVIDWLNNGSGDVGNSNSINRDRDNNKITSDNVVNDTKSSDNVKDNNASVMDKDTKASKSKNNYLVLFGIIFFVLISMVVVIKKKK